jgi:hypothetical protein
MGCLRVVVLTVLCAVIPSISAAQTVELVYTPAVLRDALALKDSLKVALVHASSALSLVGATADRKKAYGDKLAGATAVVIIGEDALKAASDVEFSAPVILVNASGRTAARGQIIRVFDSATAPPGAIPVGSSAVVNVIGSAREVTLKGQVNTVVQAVIVALK